ncbi:fluoride efflux transporter CrcB [Dellaglioa sp. L3N]
MMILLVGLGAAVGAMLRYGLTNLSNQLLTDKFPVGTLSINLIGCLILGILTGLNLSNPMLVLLGTGTMGGFTTFSTYNFELIKLIQSKKVSFFMIYLLVSYIIGGLMTFLGLVIGRQIGG